MKRAELWWVKWTGILYRQQVTLTSEQGRAVIDEVDRNSIQDNRQHWLVNRAELWWVRWTGIVHRQQETLTSEQGRAVMGEMDGNSIQTTGNTDNEQGRAVMGEMDGNSIQENRKHWQVNRAELSWVRWIEPLHRTTGNTDKWTGQSCHGWDRRDFYTGQKVTMTSEQGRAVMDEVDRNSIQDNRQHWQVNRAELWWVRWTGILYRQQVTLTSEQGRAVMDEVDRNSIQTTGNTDKWTGQSCDGWGGREFYTDNR